MDKCVICLKEIKDGSKKFYNGWTSICSKKCLENYVKEEMGENTYDKQNENN